MIFAANEDHPVRDRRRSQHRLAHRIRPQHSELRSGLNHTGFSILTRQQDLSIIGYRRARELSPPGPGRFPSYFTAPVSASGQVISPRSVTRVPANGLGPLADIA